MGNALERIQVPEGHHLLIQMTNDPEVPGFSEHIRITLIRYADGGPNERSKRVSRIVTRDGLAALVVGVQGIVDSMREELDKEGG